MGSCDLFKIDWVPPYYLLFIHRESPKIINVGVRVKNIVQAGCG